MSLTLSTKAILDEIIEKQEGGWVLTSNSNDPDGGWTYAGVTSTTFNKNRQEAFGSTSVLDYAAISKAIELDRKAVDDFINVIYKKDFIDQLQLSNFNSSLRGPFLSCAINRGTTNAIKVVQVAINNATKPSYPKLLVDGVLGDKTKTLLNILVTNGEVLRLIRQAFLHAWMLQYINLVQDNAEAWRDFSLGLNPSEPSVLRATSLEGWYERVEYWR